MGVSSHQGDSLVCFSLWDYDLRCKGSPSEGHSISQASQPLLGRSAECAELDRLLSDAEGGLSRVIVLRGEAGVGKSSLLAYLSDRASGWRVVRTAGVESEMELAYSGLQQLCSPLLEQLDRLPEPQREALETVFGRSSGVAPDGMFVGLAALTLLAESAEDKPLLCIVDDAHWLDHATTQTLGFVARRLLAERIALVCVARSGLGDHVLAGLPELVVDGIGDGDARALLLENVRGPLDAALVDQIVAESHGNPLALMELPRTWDPAKLAGGFGSLDGQPVAGRIEQSYVHRLSSLDSGTRMLVLVAAAEPLGDPLLLANAVATLGLEMKAADAAIDAGLLRIGGRVEFAHPLVRSATYREAAEADRQEVHRALAAATNGETDPDRQAWHLAQAALGPDEAIAADLERSAERAHQRGGYAAMAAFLARAAELTPEPHRRAQRMLAAAGAKRLAGLTEAAAALVASAEYGPLDDRDVVIARRLRGQLALDLNHATEGAELLLDAAKALVPLDIALARETFLEALLAACTAGDGTAAAAAAAMSAPPSPAPTATDGLMDGLALLFTDGPAAAVPPLRKSFEAFLANERPDERELRGTRMAARVAGELLHDDLWVRLAEHHVRIARKDGLFGVLPLSLGYLGAQRIHEGDLEG